MNAKYKAIQRLVKKSQIEQQIENMKYSSEEDNLLDEVYYTVIVSLVSSVMFTGLFLKYIA